MNIGPVRLENPFILAPMAGVSDPPFRRLCRRGGAALVCAEMVSANALHFKDAKSRRMLQTFPDEHPISMQVFGAEPERLAEAARMAEGEGADVVDLNCGCPVPKITKTGAGFSLMQNESLFFRCLDAMVKAVKIPVTVKLRLGWKPGENRAAQFARVAEEAGVAAVTVHARCKEARHSGPADLSALREVVSSVRVPVIGNGGIRSVEDARRMMAESGCQAVMVGQAAMGNPFLFEELAQPGRVDAMSLAERFQVFREHARLNAEYFGEELGVARLRKFVPAYTRGLAHAAEFRARANTARTLSGLFEAAAVLEQQTVAPSV
jgi:tRNA-dihydrouridine synthase B